MATSFLIPQNSQPFLDKNGLVNRPWYLFLQAMWLRVGGPASGEAGDDLSPGGGGDGSDPYGLVQGLELGADGSDVRDALTELAREVQALKQGYQL